MRKAIVVGVLAIAACAIALVEATGPVKPVSGIHGLRGGVL